MSFFLRKIAGHEAPEKYPKPVLSLLIWLLEGYRGLPPTSLDVGSVKERWFVSGVKRICESSVSLDVADAVALKHKLLTEFGGG